MADITKKEDVRVFTPYVDITEKSEDYEIFADVPGAVKDGIDISLDSDVLTVKIKTRTPELGGLPLIRREYLAGDYEVSFRVSEGVDREKIAAELKDGVLKLTLPKSEAVKPRRIEVKAA